MQITLFNCGFHNIHWIFVHPTHAILSSHFVFIAIECGIVCLLNLKSQVTSHAHKSWFSFLSSSHVYLKFYLHCEHLMRCGIILFKQFFLSFLFASYCFFFLVLSVYVVLFPVMLLLLYHCTSQGNSFCSDHLYFITLVL